MSYRPEENVYAVDEEHRLFLEEVEYPEPFLGFTYIEISVGEAWVIFREGVFFRELHRGSHIVRLDSSHRWNTFRQKKDSRLLLLTIGGYVKAPPSSRELGLSLPEALGLSIKADLSLTCRITDFHQFLSQQKPVTALVGMINAVAALELGAITYDVYGAWARTLRDKVQEQFRMSRDPERMFGIEVVDIFITRFEANPWHDKALLSRYLAVERTRRELIQARESAVRTHPSKLAFDSVGSSIDIFPQYYSCFISYSSQDEVFARQLYGDLRQNGVNCWFAPHNLKPGDYFRKRIDEAIQSYDKLLLILSEHSVTSGWVRYEVELAFSRENNQQCEILFPIRLDQSVLKSTTSWASSLRVTRYIGNFTNWEDYKAYQQSLSNLLRHLTMEKNGR